MTVVGPTLFAALVWATLLSVLLLFLFLLYGVIRAGGVDLGAGEGH